jgi:hypothetical protein
MDLREKNLGFYSSQFEISKIKEFKLKLAYDQRKLFLQPQISVDAD